MVITHLKLQKLVCIAYGFYLAASGERLFRERIEAWDLGLVVPELYHEFKRYGNAPIARQAVNYDFRRNRFYAPRATPEGAPAVLEFVWKQYGRMSASQLVAETHGRGGPWHVTVSRGDTEVRDDDFRSYYDGLIRQLEPR